MEDRINFRDANRYFIKGYDILKAFFKRGLSINQARVIMRLYEAKSDEKGVAYQELKKITGIENSGQFSRDIIMPLREEGYIGKAHTHKKIKYEHIEEKGKKSIEEVIKECGY